MKNIKYLLYGFIIGIANAIPGVSGGTMAVILNIYDRVLLSLSPKKIKEDPAFLSLLFSGILLGLYGMSNIMVFLFKEQSGLLSFCFFGIILGSIPVIYKRSKDGEKKTTHYLLFLCSLIFMTSISLLPVLASKNTAVLMAFEQGSTLYLWLFIASTLAMIAMILPGISGSLILLILGVYDTAMEAVSSLDIALLLPLLMGVLLGGFLGINTIKALLINYHKAFYFIVLGLVTGSLPGLYPEMKSVMFSPPSYILLIIFFIITYKFSKSH